MLSEYIEPTKPRVALPPCDEQDWDLGAVLLIEDGDRNAELAQATLSSISCRIERAKSESQAFDALEDGSFRVILIDIGQVASQNLAMLRAVRSMSSAAIVAMSAAATPTSAVAALDAGADDYLEKPVRPAELRARVRTILRRSPRASGRREEDRS